MARLVRKIGITVLHVTNDREDAWVLASHVTAIHDGEMLQHGIPETIFKRPKQGYVAGIVGAMNLVSERVVSKTGTDLGVISSKGILLYSSDLLKKDTEVIVSIRPENMIVAGQNLLYKQ